MEMINFRDWDKKFVAAALTVLAQVLLVMIAYVVWKDNPEGWKAVLVAFALPALVYQAFRLREAAYRRRVFSLLVAGLVLAALLSGIASVLSVRATSTPFEQ